MSETEVAFWAVPLDELLHRLETKPEGLGSEEAERRRRRLASRRLKPRQDIHPLTVLLAQFRSPIILLLLGSAIISLFLADRTDALII